MKRTLIVSAGSLFGIGVVGGWMLSPLLVQWFQAATGSTFVSLSPYGPVVDRLEFALAFGALFGLAPLLARWTRESRLAALARTESFLVVGLLVSAVGAWITHLQSSGYKEIIDAVSKSPENPVYLSISAVSSIGIPIAGCAVMILFAILLKVASRVRASGGAEEGRRENTSRDCDVLVGNARRR